MTSLEKLVIICDCESPEHQFILRKDSEDGEVWLESHLYSHQNFFKRLWMGMKYAFGYKSRYGNFDCVIISKSDQQKIIELLQTNTK